MLTLLTPGRGKIRATARGARRSKRRFPGCLELFVRIEVQVAEGARGGWARLEEAVLLDAHEGLKKDLVAIAQAGYLAELVEATTKEDDPAPELYDLLRSALEALQNGHVSAAALRHYELDLLQRIGWAPHLDGCVSCGRTEAKAWTFDFDRGGILCPDCEAGPRREPIEMRVLDLLRTLRISAPEAPLDRELMAKARDLLAKILDPIVARPLKAREFLRQLARESSGGPE